MPKRESVLMAVVMLLAGSLTASAQQGHTGHPHGTAAHLPAQNAKMEVRDEPEAGRLLVRIGPLNLPARTDHMQAEQPPEFFLDIGFDGWIVSYSPRLVDLAGTPVPGRLLHHVAFWNVSRSDFLCPNKQEHIFGAGGEMNEWPALPGFGYRVRRGDRIRMSTMFHNPTEQDHPETFLEVSIGYAPVGSGRELRSVYPAWFDVKECGGSSYTLPAGRDLRHGRFKLNHSGVLLGVGGHLHDYGRRLELKNLSRSEPVAALESSLDPQGRILSMPIVNFAASGGYRLNRGEELEVTAEYENPTGDVLPDGAMGIVVGYFVPDDDAQMAELERRPGKRPGGSE